MNDGCLLDEVEVRELALEIFVARRANGVLIGKFTIPVVDGQGDVHPRDNLAERRNMLASVLSGGEQQMLAISRAMLAKPKLMLLDEPSLGLSPLLVSQLFELIKDLNRDGLAIILVEQNTNKALAAAARGFVLELGTVVLAGPAADLLNDSRLEEAYLGG